jgi:septal ring-binding cell division protein DamX
VKPAAVEAKPATAAGVGTFGGAGAFLGLDPARYTVQLARAARPDAFEALATELGIARGELYAVPWDQAGQRIWLLFWGEFADESSARAAVARLAGAERLVGAWPRRIRAMQDELRHSGARDRQP